eukprot:UN05179
MSTETTDFDKFDEDCKKISNRKHGSLAELIESRSSSKRMCNIGILLAPLLVGIPLDWMECKRNHLIKQKLPQINLDWNKTYQKCIKEKQRESLIDKCDEKSIK